MYIFILVTIVKISQGFYMNSHNLNNLTNTQLPYTESLDFPYLKVNNLRIVLPYQHEFVTRAKPRWIGKPIFDVLTNEFISIDAEGIEEAFRNQKIHVENNGNLYSCTRDYIIKPNDIIRHRTIVKEPPSLALSPKILLNLPLVLVVSKPVGIAVYPTGTYRYNTLSKILKVEYLKERLKETSDIFLDGRRVTESSMKLLPLHRIDRLVSGIVVFAKSPEAASYLSQEIAQNRVQKVYLARVSGKFPERTYNLICENGLLMGRGYVYPIDFKNAIYKFSERSVAPISSEKESRPKLAETHFRFLTYDSDLDESLILCYPKTGRTHQIRAHLQFLNHPISNDPNYGDPDFKLKGMSYPGVPCINWTVDNGSLNLENSDVSVSIDSKFQNVLQDGPLKGVGLSSLAYSNESSFSGGLFLHAIKYSWGASLTAQDDPPFWAHEFHNSVDIINSALAYYSRDFSLMSYRQVKKLLSKQAEQIEVVEENPILNSRKKFSFVDYSLSSDSESEEHDDSTDNTVNNSHNSVKSEPPKEISPVPDRNRSGDDSEDELEGCSVDDNLLESFSERNANSLFKFKRIDFNMKTNNYMDKGDKSNLFTKTRHNRRGFVSRLHWLIQEPSNTVIDRIARSNLKMTAYNDESLYNNSLLFKLEPSQEYINIRTMIDRAVDAQDLNLIGDIIRESPLHVYGLLKFVDIYAMQNQHEEAFKTLKIALEMLQLSFHKDFNPFNLDSNGHPLVLMDSNLYENRILFTALSLYMIHCEKQTCYKTALSISKLLLAMDIKNDVTHSILHIDHYLIALNDLNQFLDFTEQFGKQRSRLLGTEEITPLQFLLPNFALALPLILRSNEHFEVNIDELYSFLNVDDPDNFKTNDRELINIYETNAANLFLIRALILFPQFLLCLSEELKLKAIGDKKLVAKLEEIGNIVDFNPPRKDVTIFCQSTAAKNLEIWSSISVLTWLGDAADFLIEALEDPLILEYKSNWASLYIQQINTSLKTGQLLSSKGRSSAEINSPNLRN